MLLAHIYLLYRAFYVLNKVQDNKKKQAKTLKIALRQKLKLLTYYGYIVCGRLIWNPVKQALIQKVSSLQQGN